MEDKEDEDHLLLVETRAHVLRPLQHVRAPEAWVIALASPAGDGPLTAVLSGPFALLLHHRRARCGGLGLVSLLRRVGDPWGQSHPLEENALDGEKRFGLRLPLEFGQQVAQMPELFLGAHGLHRVLQDTSERCCLRALGADLHVGSRVRHEVRKFWGAHLLRALDLGGHRLYGDSPGVVVVRVLVRLGTVEVVRAPVLPDDGGFLAVLPHHVLGGGQHARPRRRRLHLVEALAFERDLERRRAVSEHFVYLHQTLQLHH
mmetsp:Transcript_31984/g.78466  ORF Transcript_31984/g.78466 Transcript_31984/m.78466 type:complete len:260 (-) Transcript_31984:43-822(-)